MKRTEKTRVVIIDIQPIDPPIGGGRLRLLGLYSGFLNDITAIYVGSYDWRGPKYRTHALSDCLTEINVPLSEEHFIAHDILSSQLGKGCIDTAFPMQGHLSMQYLNTCKEEIQKADIVIFSHPWVFPFVAAVIDEKRQLLVYDSQNCEGILRVKLLDDGSDLAEGILREAVRCECELCQNADLIFACSEEDRSSFADLYHIDVEKIIIVPNGVFSKKIVPCDNPVKKGELRRKLRISKPAICFIGSGYYPNEEAARLILETALSLPQYQFIIIGGVGQNLNNIDRAQYKNVIFTGFVEEHEKLDWLSACDIAINPMLSGSGTNIKMFDFMAAGLPVITTDVGARGIRNTSGYVYLQCEKNKEDLTKKIQMLLEDKLLFNKLRSEGRRVACEKFSWEQISYELGYVLVQKYANKVLGPPPTFSVIVPTYERHDLLEKLLDRLSNQSFHDFEVIVVDQSKETFAALDIYKQRLNILYFKTEVKGAAKARNTGCRLAKGSIIAFIDDDCIPEINWLENAEKYFCDPRISGLEGLIKADIYDNENYRVVSNVNFEGIGFMTANLFIRSEVIWKIGGLDEAFDNPHFREDTDLGWRALQYGDIPYAKDVSVLHPSHKRLIGRESAEERNKFFVHDPLLLKKHPEKFIQLFLSEGHYREDAYWDYFLKGIERHSISKDIIHDFINEDRVSKCIPRQIRSDLNEVIKSY